MSQTGPLRPLDRLLGRLSCWLNRRQPGVVLELGSIVLGFIALVPSLETWCDEEHQRSVDGSKENPGRLIFRHSSFSSAGCRPVRASRTSRLSIAERLAQFPAFLGPAPQNIRAITCHDGKRDETWAIEPTPACATCLATATRPPSFGPVSFLGDSRAANHAPCGRSHHSSGLSQDVADGFPKRGS